MSRISADKSRTKGRKRAPKAHRLPTEANHEATTPCIRITPQWSSGLKRDLVAGSFSSEAQGFSRLLLCHCKQYTGKKKLYHGDTVPSGANYKPSSPRHILIPLLMSVDEDITIRCG